MFAAARDLPKRPTHIQTHTHPLSSADVSVVGRETYDRDREKWKLRKIQVTLLSELRGLVNIIVRCYRISKRILIVQQFLKE